MSTQRSNKTTRTPSAIITENPNRRSRAERTLAMMTLASYPHCLIGNTVNVIYGGDDRSAQSALAVENKLGLLDFVRCLSISVNNGKVEFTIESMSVEPSQNKAQQLNDASKLSLLAIYHSTDERSAKSLGGAEDLLRQYVEVFHRTQVRGMTRKFDIQSDNWKLENRTLSIKEGARGLQDLVTNTVRTDTTFNEVLALLKNTVQLPHYRLTFGLDRITVSVGDDNTQDVLFVLPERK